MTTTNNTTFFKDFFFLLFPITKKNYYVSVKKKLIGMSLKINFTFVGEYVDLFSLLLNTFLLLIYFI